MRACLRCRGGRLLVTAGALWLATFFCVVTVHHPNPGAGGAGLFDTAARFPHRTWHHHSVGAGTEVAVHQGLDTCAICVARAGFRGAVASAPLSHPAGDHGQTVRLTASYSPVVRLAPRPPTRGPPIV